MFQWAPTLGGECYKEAVRVIETLQRRFNGHPPLGVNATAPKERHFCCLSKRFQWAPTLGGECYLQTNLHYAETYLLFQWAPTLGGECYDDICFAAEDAEE